MEDPRDHLLFENKPMRPKLLKVLCILTFIWSGYQVISNMIVALYYDQFTILIKTINKTIKMPGMDLILGSPPLFFGVSSMIYAGCLAGALVMWKLKKAGFHIYTISQILLLIIPMYFFQLPGPFLFDIILSAIFIILYGSNLKYMS